MRRTSTTAPCVRLRLAACNARLARTHRSAHAGTPSLNRAPIPARAFGNLSVAFLPQKESIYTLAENGDLAVLRDGETDFTLTSGADEERDDRAVRIVPLWNALGVLQAKRVGRSDAPLRLLVFDVSSPTKPRLLWATRTTDPIRTAVSDGEWVAVISQTTGSKPETRVQVHSIH